MKNKKSYEQIINELFDKKTWISNADFAAATGGSPKFTSRISDMRRKGVEIVDRWVNNKTEGRHKEYARKVEA